MLKDFKFHIEFLFFFYEYRVYMLKGFKFYIEKIKYFYSIYIMNFKNN